MIFYFLYMMSILVNENVNMWVFQNSALDDIAAFSLLWETLHKNGYKIANKWHRLTNFTSF